MVQRRIPNDSIPWIQFSARIFTDKTSSIYSCTCVTQSLGNLTLYNNYASRVLTQNSNITIYRFILPNINTFCHYGYSYLKMWNNSLGSNMNHLKKLCVLYLNSVIKNIAYIYLYIYIFICIYLYLYILYVFISCNQTILIGKTYGSNSWA